MRTTLPAVACCLGLLVSATALADGDQQSAQPSTTPATWSTTPEATDGNRIVCKHAIHEGMLLRQVSCASQRQWDAARYEAQRTLREMQMRGLLQ